MAWYNIFKPQAQAPTFNDVIREAGYDPLTLIYNGGTITRDKAAAMTALNRAVTLIAGSAADSVIDSLRVIDARTSKVVKGHPAADRAIGLLTDSPDGLQSAHTFIEDAMTDLLASGSAIFIVDGGTRMRLGLANPLSAYVHTDGLGRVMFDLIRDDAPSGVTERFGERSVVIARWPRLSGRSFTANSRSRFFGTPPINTLQGALALALGAERWASAVFDRKSGALGSDYAFLFDRTLTKDVQENLIRMLKAFGEGRAPIVLDQGAKVQKMSPTPQDTDLMNLRKFQIGEIARVFGVPSVLIGMEDSGNTWGSSIHELDKSFRRYSLRLHLNRLLAPLTHRLLPSHLRLVVDESRAYRGDAAALKSIIEVGRPSSKGAPAVFTRSELRSLFGIEDEYKSDWPNFEPARGGGADGNGG